MNYAGFWIRSLATLLDVIILDVPTVLIAWLLLMTKISALVFLVFIAETILVVWLNGIKGGTPGKILLGIKIVDLKGKQIGIPRSTLRYLAKLISYSAFLTGVLMIIWDKKKQGWHDKVSGTMVLPNKFGVTPSSKLSGVIR